jgi:hypothetical protein
MQAAGMEISLFDRLTPGCIRTDPFPHAVIRDALPDDLCARLIATRPPISPPPKREAVRTAIPAWMLQGLDLFDPAWRALATRHVRPDILRRVHAVFAEHWPAHLPDPPAEDSAYGTLWQDTHETHTVLCDARLELISPNPTGPASHRKQHLDAGNRLFSALFYLRDPTDESAGGGLTLFRFRGAPPARLDVQEFPDYAVAAAVTVPYRANTLVVFPNRPDALHGSEIRQPTPHDRAYLFVTAEVAADLF